MNDSVEWQVSRIAAATREPTRARILYCLLDGHAPTRTELPIVADVSPSTASDHLGRLKGEGLVAGTPSRLRTARTCYDHMAGEVGRVVDDRFNRPGWLGCGVGGAA